MSVDQHLEVISLYFCKCLAFRIKPQKCWECVCATDVLRDGDDALSLPAGSTCPQTVTSADRHQRGDPVLLFGKMERSTKLDDLAPSGSLRDLWISCFVNGTLVVINTGSTPQI